VKIAPDVPQYCNNLAKIEHNHAATTDNPVAKSEALSKAYGYDLKGFQANPMEVNNIYQLVFPAWEAGNNGRPELRQETIRLYERIMVIIPSDSLAQERHKILTDALAQ
jgi:hypothetical protein